MSAFPCYPGREHRFNVQSGWCEFGCGVRDDDQLDALRARRRSPARLAHRPAADPPRRSAFAADALDFTEPRRSTT